MPLSQFARYLRVWRITALMAHTAQLEKGAGHALAPGPKALKAPAAARRLGMSRPRGPLCPTRLAPLRPPVAVRTQTTSNAPKRSICPPFPTWVGLSPPNVGDTRVRTPGSRLIENGESLPNLNNPNGVWPTATRHSPTGRVHSPRGSTRNPCCPQEARPRSLGQLA